MHNIELCVAFEATQTNRFVHFYLIGALVRLRLGPSGRPKFSRSCYSNAKAVRKPLIDADAQLKWVYFVWPTTFDIAECLPLIKCESVLASCSGIISNILAI